MSEDQFSGRDNGGDDSEDVEYEEGEVVDLAPPPVKRAPHPANTPLPTYSSPPSTSN